MLSEVKKAFHVLLVKILNLNTENTYSSSEALQKKKKKGTTNSKFLRDS
jgi:hypothetical protein